MIIRKFGVDVTQSSLLLFRNKDKGFCTGAGWLPQCIPTFQNQRPTLTKMPLHQECVKMPKDIKKKSYECYSLGTIPGAPTVTLLPHHPLVLPSGSTKGWCSNSPYCVVPAAHIIFSWYIAIAMRYSKGAHCCSNIASHVDALIDKQYLII